MRIVDEHQQTLARSIGGERANHPARQRQWRAVEIVGPRRECAEWQRAPRRGGRDLPDGPSRCRGRGYRFAGESRFADTRSARYRDTTESSAVDELRDDADLLGAAR